MWYCDRKFFFSANFSFKFFKCINLTLKFEHSFHWVFGYTNFTMIWSILFYKLNWMTWILIYIIYVIEILWFLFFGQSTNLVQTCGLVIYIVIYFLKYMSHGHIVIITYKSFVRVLWEKYHCDNNFGKLCWHNSCPS